MDKLKENILNDTINLSKNLKITLNYEIYEDVYDVYNEIKIKSPGKNLGISDKGLLYAAYFFSKHQIKALVLNLIDDNPLNDLFLASSYQEALNNVKLKEKDLSNKIIYTPKITVFKDELNDFKTLKKAYWYDINILTKVLKDKSYLKLNKKALYDYFYDIFESLIEVAIGKDIDVLVFGDFNYPKKVLKVILEVLKALINNYECYFKHLHLVVKENDYKYLKKVLKNFLIEERS